MDEVAHPGNGSGHVTVREWAEARARDRKDIGLGAEAFALQIEERMISAMNEHRLANRETDKATNDRLFDLAKGLDGVQSIIDQQRGARNLLYAVMGTSLISAAVSILSIYAALNK